MLKRLLVVISMLLLFASMPIVFGSGTVVSAQTIPTRTPTPSSNGGGSGGGSGGGGSLGGGVSTAVPTSRPQATSTPRPNPTSAPQATNAPQQPTSQPQATATSWPTATPWPTSSPFPTKVPEATWTRTPTRTPIPTSTPPPTWTRTPTNTPPPTWTSTPTSTPWPTWTSTPTNTPVPTWTPRPANTPVPTWTPLASGNTQPTWTPRPPGTAVPTWTREPTKTAVPTWTPSPASNNASTTNTTTNTDTNSDNSGSDSNTSSAGQATSGSGGTTQVVANNVASCNLLPQAQPAFADTILRSGPDMTYDVVQIMSPDDVLQVLGRFGFGPWWYVEILDGTQRRGWASDSMVNLTGYVNLLPELGAPALNGVQPTPAPRWQITPVPTVNCSCGLYPVVQANADATSVYSGPGATFDVVGSLNYLSMSPIQARYGFGEWWQIKLPSGQLGWIAHGNVIVYGHTALAPVLEAAQIAADIIPGEAWVLDPNADCVNPISEAINTSPSAEIAVDTTSASQTAVVESVEPTPTDVPQSAGEPEPTQASAERNSNVDDTAEANNNDDETAVESPTAVPTESIAVTGSDSVQLNQGEDSSQGGGAIEIDNEPPAGSSLLSRALLSLAGGLGLGAAAWYFLSKRSRGDSVSDEVM